MSDGHSPVGLTPDWKPSGGARAAICAAEGAPAAAEPLAALLPVAGVVAGAAAALVLAGAGAAPVAAAGPGTTTVAGFWPALTAACCAVNGVETMGQPLPGPFKFWRVTAAALIRADCEACELSVGNDNFTEGLLSTKPALTFWLSSYMVYKYRICRYC